MAAEIDEMEVSSHTLNESMDGEANNVCAGSDDAEITTDETTTTEVETMSSKLQDDEADGVEMLTVTYSSVSVKQLVARFEPMIEPIASGDPYDTSHWKDKTKDIEGYIHASHVANRVSHVTVIMDIAILLAFVNFSYIYSFVQKYPVTFLVLLSFTVLTNSRFLHHKIRVVTLSMTIFYR